MIPVLLLLYVWYGTIITTPIIPLLPHAGGPSQSDVKHSTPPSGADGDDGRNVSESQQQQQETRLNETHPRRETTMR